MLLNTLIDYVLEPDTNKIKTDVYFHINFLDVELYDEYRMPYRFNEEGVLIDVLDGPVMLNIDLIDSIDWEIVDE